jgi:hypothetical protein
MAPPCQVELGDGAGAPAGTRGCAHWTRTTLLSGLVAALLPIGHWSDGGDGDWRRRMVAHGGATLQSKREGTERRLSTGSSPGARRRGWQGQARSEMAVSTATRGGDGGPD